MLRKTQISSAHELLSIGPLLSATSAAITELFYACKMTAAIQRGAKASGAPRMPLQVKAPLAKTIPVKGTQRACQGAALCCKNRSCMYPALTTPRVSSAIAPSALLCYCLTPCPPQTPRPQHRPALA